MLAKKLEKAHEKIEELNLTIHSLKQLNEENHMINNNFEINKTVLDLQIKNNYLQNELEMAKHRLDEYMSSRIQHDSLKGTNTFARGDDEAIRNHINSYKNYDRLQFSGKNKGEMISQTLQNLDLMTLSELKEYLFSISEMVEFFNIRKSKLNQIHKDIQAFKTDEDLDKIIDYILSCFNIAISTNSDKLTEAELIKSKIQSLLHTRTRDISDIFSLKEDKMNYDNFNNPTDRFSDLNKFQQTVNETHKRNENINSKHNIPIENELDSSISIKGDNYLDQNCDLIKSNISSNDPRLPNKFYYPAPTKSNYISLRRNKSRRMLDEKIHLLAETPENMDYNNNSVQNQNMLINKDKIGQILNQNIDEDTYFNENENSFSPSPQKTSALEQFNNMKFECINNDNNEAKNHSKSKDGASVPLRREKLPPDMNRERYLLKDKINQQYM